jgi:predicted Rossmann fold nucleotide-binding protein DprA/Smf involved in DNA uptake
MTASLAAGPPCPYIEKLVACTPGRRALDLLPLGSEELAGAAAPRVAAQILARVESLPECRLRADLAAAQCWAVCRHDDRYPAGLRAAADAPWALVGRGDPVLLDRLAPGSSVAVVGARRASAYGREAARASWLATWRERVWPSSAVSPSASMPARIAAPWKRA